MANVPHMRLKIALCRITIFASQQITNKISIAQMQVLLAKSDQ